MIKIFADENISIETVQYMRNLGYDIISVQEAGLCAGRDEEIYHYSLNSQRVILTFDLDFGYMYYFKYQGKIGTIILRIKPQTVENTNKTLEKLHTSSFFKRTDLQKALIIVGNKKVRILTYLS